MNQPLSTLTLEQQDLFARLLAEEGLDSGARQAIPRLAPADAPPLSYAQQRLWFLEQLQGGTSAYHIPSSVRLRGALNIEALERAINQIVQRHEVLRSAFTPIEGQPVLSIATSLTVRVEIVDAGSETQARDLAAKAYHRPFDLRQAPLFRVQLLRVQPEDHILLIVMHHIVSDGWSMSVIYRELEVLYEACCAGRPGVLPDPAIQYADFAAWQRGHLRGEVLDRHIAYWKGQLDGAPKLLELPADSPRPPVQTFQGGILSRDLDQDTYRALRELGKQEGATLFMTTLAAFAVLLHRHSGQDDLVIGSPIAGRDHVEVEQIIGFFINTLALRVKLAGNPRFRELLAGVKETVLDAFAHQELPFEKLVEALECKRSLSYSPIFQVFFNLIRYDDEIRLQGIETSEFRLADLDSKFDFTLYAIEENGGLRLDLTYNSHLFSAARMEQMLSQFERLLGHIVAAPDARVGTFPLSGGNAALPDPKTRLSRQPFESILDRLAAVQTGANHPAIEDAAGGLTYETLEARSNQVANRLRGGGLVHGDVVAIWGHRNAPLAAAMLGVWKAGGALVVLDPSYPSSRLCDCVLAVQPKAWIAIEAAGAVPADLAKLVAALPKLPADWERVPAADSSRHAGESLAGGDVAYLVFTSGTTGKPNAIETPHDALSHFLAWHTARFQLSADDRFSLLSGLSHDPLLRDVFTPLWLGATLFIPDPDTLLAPGALRAWLKAARISVIHATPALLELLTAGAQPHGTLPDLRYVFSGGDVLTRSIVDRVVSLAPNATVVNFYGTSETPQAVAYHVAAGARGEGKQAIPIGRGITDVQLLVVNEARQLAGVGELGEIQVRTPYLARGYAGNEQLTRRRFVVNAATGEEDDRIYRTGDLGRYLPDGSVEFHGRADGQLKIRGFRVEPAEIERILREHPSVRNAVACGKNDANGNPLLAAFVVGVPAEQRKTVFAELRDRLRARAPEYMTPAIFVALDEFPLTPNGKIDIPRLLLPVAAEEDAWPGAVVLPTPIEQSVASIWRELLPSADIGMEDNFFDVGGNSLLLVKLHYRLREAFATELELIDLFRYPTVMAMAQRIEREGSGVAGEAKAAAPPARREFRSSGEIAIVGMAGRFPGAANVAEFWRNLCGGVESISFFSDTELAARGVDAATLADPAYVRAGAALDGMDQFDASFFGLTPREAEITDPQHRMFLECAWEAMELAGYNPEDSTRTVGVFGGASANTYLIGNLLRNPKRLEAIGGFSASVLHGNEKDYLPARVAYKLGLRGPSMAIQTACSTSLVAVSRACQSLLSNECDMALAGGVAANVWQRQGYQYEQDGIVSPDGHCRAFDAKAQGTIFGSGVGLVVLKRLEDALADGDDITAVIKGFALNNDGALRAGFTAPSIDGQAAVVREALATAGVDPETVTYIEAHGTGTSLGDPIEVEALTHAFRSFTQKKQYCAIGSVKTNVGHLNAAAGVAGLIKAALAVRHGLIPPSLHYDQPNPRIDFAASPFYVNARLQEWISDGPRRAGVSSFGIGGTNAHLVLEQAPARLASAPSRPVQILPLSARTPSALHQMATNLAEHLETETAALAQTGSAALAQTGSAALAQTGNAALADTAYTLALGRKGFQQRMAVVSTSAQDAIESLRSPVPSPALLRGEWKGAHRGVAMLLAGQGSQYVGMGRELYQRETVFRQEIDRACDYLKPLLSIDLRAVMHTGPAHLLRQTWVTQPALYVLERALLKQWESWGVRPGALLGHSLGELVAAEAAGVWDEEAGLRLVALRGRLMWATEPGAMLSVLLPEEQAAVYLGPGISLAALNGRRQVVYSGEPVALADLQQRLEAAGVPVRRLEVERAFHSASMESIRAEFLDEIGKLKLRRPQQRYVSNVTGRWAGEEVCTPEYWWRQMREPVRFAAGVRELAREQDWVWLEVGPGEALGRMVRAELQSPERPVTVAASLAGPREDGGEQQQMVQALGTLWVNGVKVDWSGYYGQERRSRVALPTYPFEKQSYWIDAAPDDETASATSLSLRKKADLADWFYVPSWKRSLPLASSRRHADTSRIASPLVFIDTLGAGAALVERLEREGRQPVVVTAGDTFQRTGDRLYQINPRQSEHYTRLFRELNEANQLPGAIVHFWLLPPATENYLDVEDVERSQFFGFYSLLFLAQALSGKPASLLVVGSGLHEVTADDVVSPGKTTALGPCRVIPQEYANLPVRCVDVALSEVARGQWSGLADNILAEIEETHAAPVVAYRNGYRWVQSFEPVRLMNSPKPQSMIREGGIYLITGGLGGIALTLASHFASTAGVKLALTTRSEFPAKEEWANWTGTHPAAQTTAQQIAALRALESQGAEVLVLRADVTDRARMAEAIAQIRSAFGGITGVVHAAGLPGGGVIELKTEEMAGRVMAPKLRGTLVLADLLAGENLDFLAICSSRASILGGPGQVDYCAANNFLDAFAQRHSQRRAVFTASINWAAWQDVGMAVDTNGPGLKLGIAPAEGVEAFDRILAAGLTQVVVSPQNLESLIEHQNAPQSESAQEMRAATEILPAQIRPHVSASYRAPADSAEREVAAIWEQVLGIAPIGADDDFLELGGHSLLAMQVVSKMRTNLHVEIGLRGFFERPTVAGIASLAARQLHQGAIEVLPVLKAPRMGDLPLSFSQRRLWLLDQLEPGSPVYNISLALRITGPLNLEALESALAETVRRHESLRTTFAEVDGAPVQRIADPTPESLAVADLSGWPETAREDHALRLINEEAQRPFNLETGRLFRARLLRLSAGVHALQMTMHHIVSDGWSIGVLLHELATSYNAFAAARKNSLPGLPIQYVDYALWQRESFSGKRLALQLDYWTAQLKNAPAVLELPTDRQRPSVRSSRGSTEYTLLSRLRLESLHDLGRETGCTLFMVLLAAFKTLLSRYSGQKDIVVGSPIAGRSRAEFESLIGFFVNTLVLRTDLDGDPTFRELLAREREVCLSAYAHQDLPFEMLVDDLAGERSLSHSPLFQVVFVLQNAPRQALELSQVRVEPIAIESETAKFDLTLTMQESGEGLRTWIEYNTDLFDRSTIQRLLRHLETLLSSAVGDPDQRISRIALLEDSERRALAASAAEGPRYTTPSSLVQWFESQAARTPEALALTIEGRHLSYRDLNGEANQLAHHLISLGVRSGDFVGIRLERSVSMVAAILAVLKAGAAYVPMDPAYPAERLNYIMDDAQVTAFITDGFITDGSAAAAKAGTAVVVNVDAGRDIIRGRSHRNPGIAIVPGAVAYIIYTSGSTGKPKGVPVTHRNVMRLMRATEDWFQFGDGDVWTLFHSCAFDFSVWEIWGALLYGGRLVVVPYWVSRTPEAFHALLAREQVTVLNQTPSAFRQLIAADLEAPSGAKLNLRYVIFGGEALDLNSLRPWVARHGDTHPQLINMYGITETTVHVTYRRILAEEISRGAKSVIGVPIPDLQLHVLDEHMEPVPTGCSGEIYVGGEGLANGYLRRPGLTAERFVPNPFSGCAGARLYRSGDVGRRLASGDLEYTGRADHQVKIRGFRIELGEIEAALRQHAAVRDALVIARPDRDGEKQLAAYLVTNEPALDASAMREFLAERLPDYMIPAAYVTLDRIPLTAHGKVDSAALPEPRIGPADSAAPYTAPRSPAEETLARIWAEVLGLERAGIDTSFFALGGDSIRAIQVRALAGKNGLQFTFQQLFQHQTIRSLAAEIAGPAPQQLAAAAPRVLLTAADRAALPAGSEDAYPLTMLQSGMVFHSEMNPASAVYHDVFSYRIRAPFDIEMLRDATGHLMARHAVLRTSFDLKSYSVPLQLVNRSVAVPLAWEDMSALAAEQQERAIDRQLQRERRRPFEWIVAPLFRVLVHRLSDDRFQFTLSFHHAMLDGWSVASLMTELFQAYFALLEHRQPDNAPLATSFRDFVAMEIEAVESPEARSFWTGKLADALPTRLSSDGAGGSEDRPRSVVSHRVELPAALSTGLRQLAQSLGVPVKSVLLAAHIRVLSRVTGAADVISGVVANGRPEQADGEKVLGLFLNTLPMRLVLGGGRWRELVQAAFDAEGQMLPYRRFPLAGMRGMNESAMLFDTVFNFIHFHVYQGLDRLPGLEFTGVKTFEETNFSLVSNFSLAGEALQVHLNLIYDPEVLAAQQIVDIGGYYARALAAMVDDPAARYDCEDLLSDGERHRLLAEWNDTAAPRMANRTVNELFEEQAAKRPNAIAVAAPGGSFTYGELDRSANRLAHYLRSLGVGAETNVGVCVASGSDMILAALGVLKAGGAYVPIDAAYPAERRAFMLKNAAAPVLITAETLRAVVHAGGTPWPDTPYDRLSLPGNVAYAIYTSGSTGLPKGVAVTHESLLNLVAWHNHEYLILPEDRGSQIASLGFDASVWEVWPYLMAGASVHVPDEDTRLSPRLLLQWIARERITVCFLPTPLAEAVLEEPAAVSLSTLRTLLTGGDRLRQVPAAKLPFRLVNHYGPTENAVVATCGDVAPGETNPPIGGPIHNVRAYVLDAAMLPVPEDTPGELYIGGDSLARGYVGDPMQTAEKFVPDPLSGGQGRRLYRTGDLVRRLPDGGLEFLGRKDEQVKLRGHRIELGEIESALRQNPAVRDAVVVLRSDEAGDPLLAAYVATADPTEAVERTLRASLAEKLPQYMIPGVFVFLTELPVTVNGKLDRKRLPTPNGRRTVPPHKHEAPRTALQAQVAGIWAEVLGCPGVGLHDNFFALGGDSLKAIRCMARLSDTLQSDLPLRILFDAPELESFTEAIGEARMRAASASDIEELLAELDNMTEEEASSLLAGKS